METKTCEKCGQEYEGEFCPHCQESPPEKKPAGDPPEEKPAAGDPQVADNPLPEIGGLFTGDWPEPQPHFVEAEKARAAEEEAAGIEGGEIDLYQVKDKQGRYFHPDMVQCDESGRPRFTKKGWFVLKKGAKRDKLPKRPAKKPEPGEPAAADMIQQQAAAEEEARRIRNVQRSAEMIDGGFWFLSQVIYQEHGAPTQKEQEKCRGALEEMFLEMEKPPETKPWMQVAYFYGQAMAVRAMNKDARKNAAGWRVRLQFLLWKFSGGRFGSPPEQKTEGGKDERR